MGMGMWSPPPKKSYCMARTLLLVMAGDEVR